jgi:hypothetical protein
MSDIDKQLEDIENQKNKDLETKEENLPAKVEIDEEVLTSSIVDHVTDDREKADEIYKLFYSKIAFENDDRQGSKEALLKSLELKIESSKNIIELLKVNAKKKENSNNLNVLFETKSEKEVGISFENIKKSMK